MSEKPNPQFMAGVQMMSALMGLTLAMKQKFGEEVLKVTQSFVGQMGTMLGTQIKEKAGVTGTGIQDIEKIYTDPDAAVEFVERTGVDALAVAIGTSHGAYKFKGEVKLDFERLKTIRKKVDIPLVLHGASGVPAWIVEKVTKYGAEMSGAKGIPNEHIKQAISLGITKINIDTDLRLAFTGSVREVLATLPKVYDPRKILGPAKENMKKVVQEKMRLFGSSGKAL